MGAGLSTKRGLIALEIEAVEGTAETLVAADATMLAYEPSFVGDPERFERDPARTNFSRLPSVVGVQPAAISWKTEFKGSGVLATQPAWAKALRACGFLESAVSSIAIGAVSDGPFEPGELITGAGGGTGRVVGEVANGAAVVFYVPVSGTIVTTEEITGGTSGATATTSAGLTAAQGFEYRPVSTSIPSATVASYLDGLRKTLAGGRGNVSFECQSGEPVFLSFAFQGVFGGVTDTALLAPTFETTIPLAFLNVGASVQGLSAIFSQLSIDMGNVIAQRTSALAVKGILSAKINDRNPTGSIDPEMELVADHDFYGKLISGATGRLYAELPGGTGQKITIAAPKIEYTGLAEGEQDRRAIAQVGFGLRTADISTGDDELQIGMIG